MTAGTYYARRTARDPDWRERQIQDAKEWRRRRDEADPEAERERRNASARAWYAKLRDDDPERFAALRQTKTERDRQRRAQLIADERTKLRAADAERKRLERARDVRGGISELGTVLGLTLEELRERVPDFGERSSLRIVLADELRRGRVELHAGVYSVNGGLDAETRRALLDLDLVDDRR